MAFLYRKNMYGPTPQFEEDIAAGTISKGDLIAKNGSSLGMIRCVAITEDIRGVAAHDAVTDDDLLYYPWLPGLVFEVPVEGTTYVDATHKNTAVDLYDGDSVIDSVQPGADTYKTVYLLGMADGEVASATTKVLVTPKYAFKCNDLDVST